MRSFLLFILSVFVIGASVCPAQNPTLWGMTSAQGNDHVGTIIQTNSTGSAFKKDYSFTEPGFGLKNIMLASNGLIYGMTGSGGAHNKGIIFSYNITTGIETDLHDFGSGTDGFDAIGSPLQASNGLLYGMTEEGGINGAGIIFRYNITTGAYADLYDFGSGTDGNDPKGTFVQATNGLLYGVTEAGGVNGKGTIFSYNIATGAETDVHDFGTGIDGYLPQCALIQATNGLLYGMTYFGGLYSLGTIFSYDITTGSEGVVHNFMGYSVDGSNPYGSLIQATNGIIYGVTQFGGANNFGVIFSYNITTATETDIHDFSGAPDGFQAAGALLQATNGLLYGVTESGGANNAGSIFSYNITTATEAIAYSFSFNTLGRVPSPGGGLIQAPNGLIYGTTDGGGAFDGGSIYSYNTASGAVIDLHDFKIMLDGQTPLGSWLEASNGLFYGMTTFGGADNNGTIISYNFSTALDTILYNFAGGADGEFPWYSALIQATNGLLYGMTSEGGANGAGTIFSYNIATGVETKLYDFGSVTDGRIPYGGLIQAKSGVLYGMTYSGGVYSLGMLFSYDITTGIETDLYDFNSSGYYPYGSLMQGGNGLLYGMTNYGGANSEGTIFSYNITTNTETDLHDFGSGTDGYYPYGSLIQASDSLLYGMTKDGGVNDLGTIFNYNITNGAEADLHDFGTGTDGQQPYGSLIQASDSLLYGMTSEGGSGFYGAIFNYNISTGAETVIHNFQITDGAVPYGNLIEDDNTLSATPLMSDICKGGSVKLIANGAITYTWSPSAGLNSTTGNSVVASPTVTTTYTITGTSNGSSKTTAVTVTVIPAPPLIIQPQSPNICLGQTVTLSVPVSGIDYKWSPAATLNSTVGDSVVATPQKQTTYTVTGIDSLGCSVSDSDIVSVSTGPSKPTITQNGNILVSSATQGNQWIRNDSSLQGATNQDYTAAVAGWYKVIASNPANGCSTTSDSVYVKPTGVNQLIMESGQLTVYPNPTAGEIFVNINSSAAEVNDWNLQVTDVLGRTVLTKSSLDYSNEIDLSNLSSGVYFISVIIKTGRIVVPVVKQ